MEKKGPIPKLHDMLIPKMPQASQDLSSFPRYASFKTLLALWLFSKKNFQKKETIDLSENFFGHTDMKKGK